MEKCEQAGHQNANENLSTFKEKWGRKERLNVKYKYK